MYLQKIEITEFSCLRDVKIELTPLHALIGPNDSGKSTILRAVRTLTQYLAIAAATKPDQPVPPVGAMGGEVESRVAGQFNLLRFEVAVKPGRSFEVSARYDTLGVDEKGTDEPNLPGLFARKSAQLVQAITANPELQARVGKPASLMRFDPDVLRQQSGLIPENESVSFYENTDEGMRGAKLPGVYDAIMNRGDDGFATIAQKVRGLFPTVRNLRLRAVSRSDKCLEVELTNGTRVPAAQMSEGLLYFLAYAALPYLTPTSILLVEEPENGLHPSRIRDVMNILREISKTTQVIVATHSPLVVNELTGDEVTVVTRDAERGTQVRRLSATADYSVRSRVYLPGELWLNYANGVDEADLFSSGKPET